jgi:hypothetical protein
MTCRLAELSASKETADFARYAMLHRDGKRLSRGWFRRAVARRVGDAGDSFEAFIFLWIAFNGWAACVTGLDSDTEWRDALTADRRVGEDFARLESAPESRLGAATATFAELWPIFRVDDLRRRQIDYREVADADRSTQVAWLLDQGAKQYAPDCWPSHEQADEIPLDWAHTLAALYRVRCNLFHGDKGRNSENDRLVVGAAFSVLMTFLEDARYIR